MDHFRIATANHRQWTQYPSFSLSAINAVSLAGSIPWEESYELMLRQCVRHGQLPQDRNCISDMLRSAGYTRLSPSPKLQNYSELSRYLTENHPQITHALILTSRGSSQANLRVCAVIREQDKAQGYTVLDLLEETRNILSLWLPWKEAGLPAPELKAPRRIPAFSSKEKHRYFQPFQPNPLQNNIGDCVIRAYAAVFDISWEEAIHRLAKSCEYCCTKLNSAHMYAFLTSEYGFTYHEPVRIDRVELTGKEFCEWLSRNFRNGERIFAKVGRCHVAGVIPVRENGTVQYVIRDSWDSSDEKIGGFWVYQPPVVNQAAPPEKEASPIVSVSEGENLIHPFYGEGTVLSFDADTGRVTVSFPKAGEKMLNISWIREHCSKR